MTDQELLARCHTVFTSHRARRPAEMFAAMGEWCEANGIEHDVYGAGDLIESFERKVAALLGFEAAVFCVSGTMTQVTALRLACQDRGRPLVALHPTSHIIVHERSNYQLLGHFNALQVGDRHRTWTVCDLQSVPDRLGAVALEIPMREIGGQITPWYELEAIKAHCRERGTHLHMDGARLWEAQAGYGKTAAQIAAGFDSVYVSLYKGIGGLGGAMLAGSREFVARASEWMKRQGGNVIHRSPYVVAAAMQFDERLAAMPAYFERTQFLYEALRAHPEIRVNPAEPQANMLHLHLPVSRDRALAIRNQLAEEHGIWIFNRASHAALPDSSYVELYIGDNMLGLSNQQVRDGLALFAKALAA
ncbi:aminotransferase class I/II-fold pyridoxal phosphate-dependent enzyme [Massilia agilis]|uniref:Aminotransferase class I/II-fold pyridoxal phosphate-dependent enzyme n=1 Tax=Massilia agilis TaxID=1811226 RepID=A0ABT2D903_9BURK|nr:aminotransferase class I/II-fold pyridoxal phosphate-dependent enzyme [Massilia agilis]MCS0807796.1 aminotransferase class I/II-fold pyridoxal phosphate-dependent enzyme [Massilia agilis]